MPTIFPYALKNELNSPLNIFNRDSKNLTNDPKKKSVKLNL